MKSGRKYNKNCGLTLIEVLVVLAILAILAALVIPAIPVPDRSKITHCMNNLKQIGLAEIIWSDDYKSDFPAKVSTNHSGTKEYLQNGRVDLHFRALASYFPTQPQVLYCPADKRKPAADFTTLNNTNISYFVSLDSTPSNSVLIAAGDCNLGIDGRIICSSVATWRATNAVGWAPGLHSVKGNSLGNFLFFDGHVECVRQDAFPALAQRLGTNANRLAFP